MKKDINLTVCLSFDTEAERETIKLANKSYRSICGASLLQVIVNLLLEAKQFSECKGSISLDGKIYAIDISEHKSV